MTRTEFLESYSDQIESVAAYARATNFDIENGNFDKLFRAWLNHGKDFCNYVADNKEDAISATKRAFIWS